MKKAFTAVAVFITFWLCMMAYVACGQGIHDCRITDKDGNFLALEDGASLPVNVSNAVDVSGSTVDTSNSTNMQSRLVNGNGNALGVDLATRTLQTIDYAHHEIHGGSHYFVVGYQDLGNGQVLDFTWVTPDTTKWAHWTWNIDTEDEINWFVYEGATVTNALTNSITPYNSDRNSTNTSVTTMKYEIQSNLAAANADTGVDTAIAIKSGLTKGGGFFTPGGGSAGRETEIILKQNTTYCLRAIANAAGFINFDMEWYEHTNKTD